MQSDTNLLANRLYTKLEDSKYRTRSLTTLLSCESYETYDTQDTISHIIDNSSLTPMKKTTMLLGLTENDIKDARDRVRKRAEHSRLTELEDESFAGSTKRDANLLFAVNNDYPPLKMNIESSNSDTALVGVTMYSLRVRVGRDESYFYPDRHFQQCIRDKEVLIRCPLSEEKNSKFHRPREILNILCFCRSR